MTQAVPKLSAGGSLFENAPLTPKVQAALMRALKAQRGIREIGRVTDPLGRDGVALAADFTGKRPYGSQLQLVFDPKTGKYLGQREVLTRPGGDYASRRPGFVIFYWLVRDSGWTDAKPEVPAAPPF